MLLCLGGSQADVAIAISKHVQCPGSPKTSDYLLPHAPNEYRPQAYDSVEHN